MRNTQINRKDKLIKEKRHDVYPKKGDWPDATTCTICGSVFTKGRWTWEKIQGGTTITCPACRRISENYPAGCIEIKGEFFNKRKEEILNLIQNVEKAEKEAHPLERIMRISPNSEHTLVTTTGIHVARRIGESLMRAYQGELSLQYADGEKRIRVYWSRD